MQSEISGKSDTINTLRESILVETSRHERRIVQLEDSLRIVQSEESTLSANLKSKTIELMHLQEHLSESIGAISEPFIYIIVCTIIYLFYSVPQKNHKSFLPRIDDLLP